MGHNWYTIRTKPQSEYISASELRRQGFEVFLPCVKSPNPRIGRDDIPLFPGYIFLNCDLDSDSVPSFAITPHALGWVNFGGIIPSIPNEDIVELDTRLKLMNRHGGLWPRFKKGETVEVIAGHLQGFAEVVASAKSPEARVKVLIEFMGRTVPAQVPWENIKSVENSVLHRFTRHRRTRGRGRWIRSFDLQTNTVS